MAKIEEKNRIINERKVAKNNERQAIEKQREYRRIKTQQEAARAELAKIEEDRKLEAERKIAKEKYQQIVIKLSEQDKLLEDIANGERIELLNTQHCPKCHVRIEKNGGCSHMHCSRCDHHFTWETIIESQNNNKILLLNNSDNMESVKEELNRIGDIGLIGRI